MKFGFDIPVHIIDFEGAPSYGVVEYGVATLVGGEIAETHTRLCRAFAPIDPRDIAVHGITYEQSLAHAPFEDDYDFFVDLRRRGPLAAHNVRYEARLVKQAWAIPPIVPTFNNGETCATWGPWIDSCALARKLAPGLERYKLACVVNDLGLSNELNALAIDRCPADRCQYHAALFDALAAALILKKLLCGETVVPEEKIFSVK
jgi:DNA polymerase-3 subunit epsilon